MPIATSTYRAPFYLPGGQLQTFIPALVPRKKQEYTRQRIDLKDGDFLDLDWHTGDQHSRLIIATHGLEGGSDSAYIQDMVAAALPEGYDVLAWNCRSCSGEMNRLNRLYHHGDIEDLTELVEYVLAQYEYQALHLIGYSMGGSLTVRYMSLEAPKHDRIVSGVAVSTPFELGQAARMLDRPSNRILRRYFIKKLKRKFTAKEAQFPGTFPLHKFDDIESITEIDEYFTAPYLGMKGADDFYEKASAMPFLHDIQKPLYAINAQNDPVLSEGCHPIEMSRHHQHVTFELSKDGGHVYFPMPHHCYIPEQALDFMKKAEVR